MSDAEKKNYEVRLSTFQGPLEVLLSLIEERKLAITQISLAEVTNQFIKYVESSPIPPGAVADFLSMAARLLIIKTKALLPFLTLSEEEEEELIDLELRLKLLQMFRDKGKWLKKRGSKGKFVSAGREAASLQTVAFYPPKNVDANSLKEAFRHIADEFRAFFEKQHYASSTLIKVVSLEERIRDLMRSVEDALDKRFHELVKDTKSKMDMIVTFLAMLQLIKDKMVEAEQGGVFGEIIVRKRSDLAGKDGTTESA